MGSYDDRKIKLICEKCKLTYYYVPPLRDVVHRLLPPSPLVTSDIDEANKKLLDQQRALDGAITCDDYEEGTIKCENCKTYYRFKYQVDPNNNMMPLPHQEITLTRDNVIQPGEEKWFDNWRNLLKESPKNLDDTAQKMITIITGVITLYTGALAFLGVTKITDSLIFDLFLILPIIVWVGSIAAYVWAYSPEEYDAKSDSIPDIKKSYSAMSKTKYTRITWGSAAFIAGILFAVSVLFIGPIFIPDILNEKPHTVQFIVTNNTSQKMLDLMYITVDSDTQRTDNVTLINATDDFYTVKYNGTVKFSKDLVDGVIYWD